MLDPMVREELDRMPEYELKSLEQNLILNGRMTKAEEVSKIHTRKQLEKGAVVEAEREVLENLDQQQAAKDRTASGQSGLETELERLRTGELTPDELSKKALIAAYETDQMSETAFASEFARRG